MAEPSTVATDRYVIAGALSTSSNGPRLVGSKCSTCHTFTFPRSFTCPNPACEGREVENAVLSRKGTLASFTVVHYPPPPPYVPPDPFEPFAIGEVAFAEGIQIVGPMTDCDPANLEMGMEVETVVEPYYTDPEGMRILGWKFRPVIGGAR